MPRSNVQSSAGAVLYIGDAAPATFDKAGYEQVTWTKVGEISNIGGDVGKAFSMNTYNLLESRGVVKRKGSYDNGSITIDYGYYRTDAGQADMTTAVDSDDFQPFRIVMPDADTTYAYFMGLVMATPVNIDSDSDFLTVSVPVEVDSETDILFEDADASP